MNELLRPCTFSDIHLKLKKNFCTRLIKGFCKTALTVVQESCRRDCKNVSKEL